jgi:hypothetical protein
MVQNEKIKDSCELEFAVFCIENVAKKLGINVEQVYQAFTEKSDILNGYIVPEYDILHTQGREYIVNDLLDVMKENNVKVDMLDINLHERSRAGMTANPILLQKKYARVVEYFAKKQNISLDAALEFFYHSETYQLIRDGISDMHCMSDAYLAEELEQEYKTKHWRCE